MSRSVLSKINTGIAVFMLIFTFYYFFIDAISIPINVIFSFLSVMFFLFGIHYLCYKEKVLGCVHITVALFLIFVVINPFSLIL
ncbi:hypothetical protein MST22_05870 [Virgibacillus halodenitrificans]|uniref:hypothetical protein n=1 Tax=Virgibacillus halodenitrificans TaxID=1482 RepID=UPI001FB5064A|nr:hypothetical protein [Virgibacillus halodenitrificans]MCJ0930677.1 hypothetical protein [Virgibacillus halodenitrificans]